MAYMRGEWDEALAIVDHSDEDPPPTARAMLEAVGLAVAAGRGEVSALARFPALRERWHREGLITVVGGGAAIELQSLRDGAAVAVATYDDICRVLGPLWGESFGARLRLTVLALAALADEAPRTSTGARDEVRATAARLVGEAEQVLAVRAEDERPFQIEGRAWEARLRAEELRLEWLLGARVDLADLVGRWRTTVDLFADLGHLLEEARARTRLAQVLRAAGDTEASQHEAGDRAGAGRAPARRAAARGAGHARPVECRGRRAHPARARDPRPGRRRSQQRRDRSAAVHLGQDGQRARLQRDGQAGGGQPHRGLRPGAAGGSHRLSERRVVEGFDDLEPGYVDRGHPLGRSSCPCSTRAARSPGPATASG